MGAATRTAKHRLRIAGRTRDVDWQQRINRQETTYFSIVRRSACWASRVNLSASTSKITITNFIKKHPSTDQSFCHQHTFERSLFDLIDLASWRNRFDQFLNDNSIINSNVTKIQIFTRSRSIELNHIVTFTSDWLEHENYFQLL